MSNLTTSRFALKRVAAVLSFAAVATALITSTAVAQNYPSGSISVIIPYAAGGGTDAIGRIVVKAMSTQLKVPMVVENKAGAATALGTQFVARSKPDGNTIMVGGPSNLSVLPALKPQATGYDVFKDFEPVGIMYSAPNVIVVRSDLPIHNIADLIKYAKENPGKLNYGSTGAGSFQHLGMEVLSAEAGGLNMVHVPYKGLGEVIPGMLSGVIHLAMSSFPPVLPHIQSGAMRAIAVTGESRVAILPDVPTGVEAGYPNFIIDARCAILAPKGTPPERMTILRDALTKAMQSDEVKDFYAKNGAIVIMPNAAEFTKFYQADQVRFRTAGKAAGLYEGP
jgi:tripartite-type tricarboxylate transporter receptor subunit TctC